MRAPNHQIALEMQPGTEVAGCHEAPAYGVVLIDETSVVMHHHDLQNRSERF